MQNGKHDVFALTDRLKSISRGLSLPHKGLDCKIEEAPQGELVTQTRPLRDRGCESLEVSNSMRKNTGVAKPYLDRLAFDDLDRLASSKEMDASL